MIRVCLFGDPGVGKTSIIEKSLHGTIPHRYRPDVGYGASWIHVHGVKFDVWDCAGCEALDFECGSWFNYLHAGIIVLDVTKENMRESLDYWHSSFRILYPHVPVILCLNKIDQVETIPDIKINMPIIHISAKKDLDLYPLWTFVQELVSKTSPSFNPALGQQLQDDQGKQE